MIRPTMEQSLPRGLGGLRRREHRQKPASVSSGPPASAEGRPWVRRAVWLAAVVVLLPLLGVGFLNDDFVGVVELGPLGWTAVLDQFHPIGSEFLRPLGFVMFRTELSLFGTRAWLFHASHLALFVLAAWLAGKLRFPTCRSRRCRVDGGSSASLPRPDRGRGLDRGDVRPSRFAADECGAPSRDGARMGPPPHASRMAGLPVLRGASGEGVRICDSVCGGCLGAARCALAGAADDPCDPVRVGLRGCGPCVRLPHGCPRRDWRVRRYLHHIRDIQGLQAPGNDGASRARSGQPDLRSLRPASSRLSASRQRQRCCSVYCSGKAARAPARCSPASHSRSSGSHPRCRTSTRPPSSGVRADSSRSPAWVSPSLPGWRSPPLHAGGRGSPDHCCWWPGRARLFSTSSRGWVPRDAETWCSAGSSAPRAAPVRTGYGWPGRSTTTGAPSFWGGGLQRQSPLRCRTGLSTWTPSSCRTGSTGPSGRRRSGRKGSCTFSGSIRPRHASWPPTDARRPRRGDDDGRERLKARRPVAP